MNSGSRWIWFVVGFGCGMAALLLPQAKFDPTINITDALTLVIGVLLALLVPTYLERAISRPRRAADAMAGTLQGVASRIDRVQTAYGGSYRQKAVLSRADGLAIVAELSDATKELWELGDQSKAHLGVASDPELRRARDAVLAYKKHVTAVIPKNNYLPAQADYELSLELHSAAQFSIGAVLFRWKVF